MMTDITDNKGHTYHVIGRFTNPPKTLLVTRKGGNGGAVMFCEIHRQVYGIVHETCAECRNAVRDEPAEPIATSCGTPEIER